MASKIINGKALALRKWGKEGHVSFGTYDRRFGMISMTG